MYTNSSLANGDRIKVIVISNATCLSVDSAQSNTVTMVVNSYVTPTVSFTADTDTSCSGETVNFYANATSSADGPLPTYDFFVDGVSVQNGSLSSYSSGSLHNSDSVWVVLTSDAACASPQSVASSKVYMTINTTTAPSVSLNASQNIICAGTPITFTANGANGGSSPTYNFYLNGNSVQNGAANTYNNSALSNNDSVWVVITSNATCALPDTAKSNTQHLTVGTSVTPSVTLTPSQNNVCSGTNIIFTAGPTNGGASPQYDFYVNGIS